MLVNEYTAKIMNNIPYPPKSPFFWHQISSLVYLIKKKKKITNCNKPEIPRAYPWNTVTRIQYYCFYIVVQKGLHFNVLSREFLDLIN